MQASMAAATLVTRSRTSSSVRKAVSLASMISGMDRTFAVADFQQLVAGVERIGFALQRFGGGIAPASASLITKPPPIEYQISSRRRRHSRQRR
jgi:hypothetical protein